MVSSSLENLKKRKGTGGRMRPYRSRRLFERDYYSADTRLGEKTVQSRRTRGGKIKKFLTFHNYVNVLNKTTGKIQHVMIKSVISNPSNRDYNRRKIITKGTIVETELGDATIISRPGQDSILNAVLN